MCVQMSLEMALHHLQSGDSEAARAVSLRVVEAVPHTAPGWRVAGIAAFRLGDVEQSLHCLGRAIALAPDDVETTLDFAAVLIEAGHPTIARDVVAAAQSLAPANPRACFLHAVALQGSEQYGEAIGEYRSALNLAPAFSEAANNLAALLNSQGEYDEAEVVLDSVLAQCPQHPELWNQMGNALAGQQRIDEARTAYEESLGLDPEGAAAAYNLGVTLEQAGRLDESLVAYDRALSIEPGLAEAANNRGVVLRSLGEIEAALNVFERVQQDAPRLEITPSNALLTCQYRTGVGREELKARHVAWASRFLPARSPQICDPDPDRRLRLGFVSADLGMHPVGQYLGHLLEGFDRDEFAVICFADGRRTDPVARRIETAADVWHDTAALSHEDLEALIRQEQVDLLFDLSGHTGGNRLAVFSRRPAPLQLSWIGYVGTTGLATMDYVVADGFHVPPEAEVGLTERVLRLPNGYVCFEPPAESPEVGPPPAVESGQVTFGSFNNPAKINADVLRLWGELLRQVPGSRLLLNYGAWSSQIARNRVLSVLQDEGIEPGRVEFRGASPRERMLRAYGEIDVALDPFPYSGGLTTCEALWMGVPVVTLPGETFASRHSLSHLSNAGFPEWVASSPTEYVEIAKALVSNLPALAARRASMRAQVAVSPLCDRDRFLKDWTTMIRQAWRERVGR